MIEKKYIAPNAITAINLLLGYLSIVASIEGRFVHAVWFIIGAMIGDTLDGKAARKFNAFSEFGKEFDSFSDAISFGLAPGILIFSVLKNSLIAKYAMPISFIYVLCVVMRLVKFNVMTTASNEKDDFSGMPSPCGAALVVSYYIVSKSISEKEILGNIDFYSHEIFIIISIVSAILMVSLIPFKTPDKVFKFIPKKFYSWFLIIVILTLKYSIFIFSFFYVFSNLKDYIIYKFLGNKNDSKKETEDSIVILKEDKSTDSCTTKSNVEE